MTGRAFFEDILALPANLRTVRKFLHCQFYSLRIMAAVLAPKATCSA